MAELRKDPITGRWAIVASERAKRPHRPPAAPPVGAEAPLKPPSGCPFCAGNEKLTPPEVAALRPGGTPPDSPGWSVRVVPNKFPALVSSGSLRARRKGSGGLFEWKDAVGVHEVVVETPDHYAGIPAYDAMHLGNVLRVCFERYAYWAEDARFKSIVVFRNYGRQAGASIEHPHSQVAALPFLSPVIGDEMRGAARFASRKGRCVFCEVLRGELELGERLVDVTDDWVVFEPFASRVPFETWIMPRFHSPAPAATMIDGERSRELLLGLAGCLKRFAGALTELGDPAYNYVVHAASAEQYHWHIEVFPKLSVAAGFEIGMGVYIDTAPPEETAAFLRSCLERAGKQVTEENGRPP